MYVVDKFIEKKIKLIENCAKQKLTGYLHYLRDPYKHRVNCYIFTCSKQCQRIERIRHLDHIQGSTQTAWDCIIRQWCCCWIRCIFESFHKCLLRRTQCRLQSILSVQRSYLESCMFVLNSCTCKYERNSDSYIMQIPEETSTFPKKCRVQIVGQKFNILAEMNCIMI